MDSCTIGMIDYGNSAGGDGGALFIMPSETDASATITNSPLTQNTAGGMGGGSRWRAASYD